MKLVCSTSGYKTFLFIILVAFINTGIHANDLLTFDVKKVSCKGESDGSITVTVNHEGSFTFYWKYPDNSTVTTTSPTISGLKTGTYELLVVNETCGEENCSFNKVCFATGETEVGKEDCDDDDDKCTNCPPPDDFNIPMFAGGDPNDIKGPAGYGSCRWISVNDVLPYIIRFENDPKIATASVNKVVVTYPIDKNADMFSFILGDIHFRNFTISVPPNSSYFAKQLDYVDSIGVIVDVKAGLDITKKQAFWIFQAFDPKTGLPNINPFVGFLGINDSITHKGEGKVQFSIKPISTAHTGDTIKAYASIVFDVNDAIRTNTEYNTIDAKPPRSKIKSILSNGSDKMIVSWNGSDDIRGSGIADYNLYVSENDAPFESKYNGVVDSSIIVNVNPGYKYKFMTIATDNVFNREELKLNGDSIISIIPKKFFISPSSNDKYCIGSNLVVKWEDGNIKYVDLEISADSGKTFSRICEYVKVSDANYVWSIPRNLKANKYYLLRAITSDFKLPIDTSGYFLIKNSLDVNAGIDTYLCVGDSINIGGNPVVSNGVMPYSYYWEARDSISNISVSNPMVYRDGEYIVNVTDAIGCTNSDTVEVKIRDLPYLSLEGLEQSYCLNSLRDTLNGYPEGGIFTGPGITGSVFNPLVAGIGNHQVKYSYTDNFGCKNSISLYLTVQGLPAVSINKLNSVYCVNSDTVKLTGTPEGGTFTGNGILDSLFIPKLAGIGTHQITYSYADSNGCSNSETQPVNVVDIPNITISGLNSFYCINADTIDLTGLPAGGVFSGNGVVNNKFIPAIAGIGTHQITYTFTDQYGGCSKSTTQSVNIVGLPNVSFSGLDSAYCADASIALLSGIPANGVFNGDGIDGNSFNPSMAGVGSHSITYTYTDPYGCKNTKVAKVKVNTIPSVSIMELSPSYCINSAAAILVGTPAGGSFSGEGITDNIFNPTIAGVGSHQITYSYTDQNGCSGSQTQSVKVNPAPNVNFSGLNSQYCINSDAVQLVGSPLGGSFSGDGIIGNSFNPALAGIGSHQITYTYTDQNGCSESQTQSVMVNAMPTVTFSGLSTQYCGNADIVVQLIGVPSGGIFSGDGISSNSFNPSTAGVGTHNITYTYADLNGCSGSQTQSVTVNAIPVITFSGLNAQYCINSEIVQLMGTPSGGVFSGDGITGSSFNPTIAGVGSHQITYSYTDQNGCSGRYTESVIINALPSVTFSGLNAQYCLNADIAQLVGIPSGGVFSGDGITANSFSPTSAGVGTHQITYTYTDQNSCSESQVQSVKVNDMPVVRFSGLNTQYCINAGSVILTGSPSGGTFSGHGITGNSFSPTTAGVGTHQITYTYTDQNGCSGSQTQLVIINAIPVVSFSGLNTQYCINAGVVQLTGSPSGGTFLGDGINGNTFSPSLAGAGTHQITYSYSDQNTCFASQTQSVTVNYLPVVTFSGLSANYNLGDPAVTLTGNPSGGIFTGDGMTNNVFTPSVAGIGTHTITYTYSSGGCTNSYSLSTSVHSVNVFSVVINATNPKCFGDCNGSASAIVSGGSGNYWYTWRTTGVFSYQIGKNVFNLCAGKVTVYVYDFTTHKTTSSSITLSEPPAIQIELSTHNTTKPNCNKNCSGYASVNELQIGGTAPYLYDWYVRSGNGRYTKISNAKSSTVNQLCEGQYKIRVTDKNNCFEEKYFAISCDKKPKNDFGIMDKNTIAVYPNPAKDKITIEIQLNEETDGEVYILDILGNRVLKVKQGILYNEKMDVNMGNLKSGMYFIQVITNDDTMIEKVLIQR